MTTFLLCRKHARCIDNRPVLVDHERCRGPFDLNARLPGRQHKGSARRDACRLRITENFWISRRRVLGPWTGAWPYSHYPLIGTGMSQLLLIFLSCCLIGLWIGLLLFCSH